MTPLKITDLSISIIPMKTSCKHIIGLRLTGCHVIVNKAAPSIGEMLFDVQSDIDTSTTSMATHYEMSRVRGKL
jgi:hypothetical protein